MSTPKNMQLPKFYSSKTVEYHETDAMGVVHHSNYVRYFEEARGDWLRRSNMSQVHYPFTEFNLAVLEVNCEYLGPCTFNDDIKIYLQVRVEKIKVRFQYFILNKKDKLIAKGETLHVMLNKNLQICRIPKELVERLKEEEWIEI